MKMKLLMVTCLVVICLTPAFGMMETSWPDNELPSSQTLNELSVVYPVQEPFSIETPMLFVTPPTEDTGEDGAVGSGAPVKDSYLFLFFLTIAYGLTMRKIKKNQQ